MLQKVKLVMEEQKRISEESDAVQSSIPPSLTCSLIRVFHNYTELPILELLTTLCSNILLSLP